VSTLDFARFSSGELRRRVGVRPWVAGRVGSAAEFQNVRGLKKVAGSACVLRSRADLHTP